MDEPKILYEEKGFLAVYKPSGMLTHRAKREEEDDGLTLVAWLLARYPEIAGVGDDPSWRPGIVHRLDRETSGALLIARTQEYFEYLKKLFGERNVKKTYLAIAGGRVFPKESEIKKPISIASGSMKRTVHKGRNEKEAITRYRVKKYFKDATLLEVEPLTGRTHQIRVHLASVGHPILGDALYGGIYARSASRLMLHALSLEFTAKDGGRLRFETEPPDEFTDYKK